jgi:hypothetical protein
MIGIDLAQVRLDGELVRPRRLEPLASCSGDKRTIR